MNIRLAATETLIERIETLNVDNIICRTETFSVDKTDFLLLQ